MLSGSFAKDSLRSLSVLLVESLHTEPIRSSGLQAALASQDSPSSYTLVSHICFCYCCCSIVAAAVVSVVVAAVIALFVLGCFYIAIPFFERTGKMTSMMDDDGDDDDDDADDRDDGDDDDCDGG